MKVDNLGFILVDLNRVGHKSDSFILASQAKQVFYMKDYKMKNDWHVVQKVYRRHFSDVLEKSNQNIQDEELDRASDDAYQEDNSSSIRLTFEDTCTEEDQFDRQDIESDELDPTVVERENNVATHISDNSEEDILDFSSDSSVLILNHSDSDDS